MIKTHPKVCVCAYASILTVLFFCPQPQHTNVCFWYIPPSLRGMPDSEERREKLHRVRHLFMAFTLSISPLACDKELQEEVNEIWRHKYVVH